jgi:hypothetical protein
MVLVCNADKVAVRPSTKCGAIGPNLPFPVCGFVAAQLPKAAIAPRRSNFVLKLAAQCQGETLEILGTTVEFQPN